MKKMMMFLVCMLVLIPSVSAEDNNDFFGLSQFVQNLKNVISEFKIVIEIPEINSDTFSSIVIYSSDTKNESEQLIELDNLVVMNVNEHKVKISERLNSEGIESVRVNVLSDDGRLLKSYVFMTGIGLVDWSGIVDYRYSVKLSKAMTYIGLIDVVIPVLESDKLNGELLDLIR